MAEQDTVRLLRECDSGIRMGVSSINDVIKYVKDEELKAILEGSRTEHESLGSDMENLLNEFHDNGKAPNGIAKGMSWLKTNMKLTFNESDATVADLITDGCNMGVKSLSKYLNQYENADDKAKKLAKRLINEEATLGERMRTYL